MARPTDQLRPLRIERNFPTQAPGSVLISMGETRVLCTAGFGAEVPKWLVDADSGVATRGWVTAEYSMLPAATPQRKRRGPDGRGTEIQRLIGRALRAAVDLDRMPGLMVHCDCDVLCADGGTRTAAITGAFVALADALAKARELGRLEQDPVISPVAAISVGLVDGRAYLDLDYDLDVRADVDMNVVMNGEGKYIEVQGTGEQGVFDRAQLDNLLDLAAGGIADLVRAQEAALKAS